MEGETSISCGRITFINSILSNLHIFIFSFYKSRVNVWRDIDKICQFFLWGGIKEKSKIHWVSRDKVCKPKELEGLGIKSIKLFNLALLLKWKWRILVEKDVVWKKVLKARYGDCDYHILTEQSCNSRNPSSTWWKDVNKIDGLTTNLGFHFAWAIIYKLVEGSSIPFSSANWSGDISITILFPDMYALSKKRGAFVDKMSDWHSGV